MTYSPKKQISAQTLQTAHKSRRLVWATMLTLSAAAALFAMHAQAQTTAPAAPAPVQADAQAQAAPPAAAAPATPAAPKYAAQDLERAFNFLDANRDGSISRSEAAAFRNVAKHFDAADTDKDNQLSREEFGNALNGGKPQ
ncbi:EF-hand domain-containing protein [Polaromonas sp.]|uniref:EF-hand domain-containing protein n=1 Tax=Polaromonas sp. TaxID=1869339 RepID=UPI003BAC41E1